MGSLESLNNWGVRVSALPPKAPTVLSSTRGGEAIYFAWTPQVADDCRCLPPHYRLGHTQP